MAQDRNYKEMAGSLYVSIGHIETVAKAIYDDDMSMGTVGTAERIYALSAAILALAREAMRDNEI